MHREGSHWYSQAPGDRPQESTRRNQNTCPSWNGVGVLLQSRRLWEGKPSQRSASWSHRESWSAPRHWGREGGQAQRSRGKPSRLSLACSTFIKSQKHTVRLFSASFSLLTSENFYVIVTQENLAYGFPQIGAIALILINWTSFFQHSV